MNQEFDTACVLELPLWIASRQKGNGISVCFTLRMSAREYANLKFDRSGNSIYLLHGC